MEETTCDSHETLAHTVGYILLLAIAIQLLAIYRANISVSERAFSKCDADSKRESRNAGTVGGDVSWWSS